MSEPSANFWTTYKTPSTRAERIRQIRCELDELRSKGKANKIITISREFIDDVMDHRPSNVMAWLAKRTEMLHLIEIYAAELIMNTETAHKDQEYEEFLTAKRKIFEMVELFRSVGVLPPSDSMLKALYPSLGDNRDREHLVKDLQRRYLRERYMFSFKCDTFMALSGKFPGSAISFVLPILKHLISISQTSESNRHGEEAFKQFMFISADFLCIVRLVLTEPLRHQISEQLSRHIALNHWPRPQTLDYFTYVGRLIGRSILNRAIFSDLKPMIKSACFERKMCIVCTKRDTKVCTGCRDARYCSVECQILDWNEHKQECKKRSLAELAKESVKELRSKEETALCGSASNLLELLDELSDKYEDPNWNPFPEST